MLRNMRHLVGFSIWSPCILVQFISSGNDTQSNFNCRVKNYKTCNCLEPNLRQITRVKPTDRLHTSNDAFNPTEHLINVSNLQSCQWPSESAAIQGSRLYLTKRFSWDPHMSVFYSLCQRIYCVLGVLAPHGDWGWLIPPFQAVGPWFILWDVTKYL